jgi:flagellar protein FlaJ
MKRENLILIMSISISIVLILVSIAIYGLEPMQVGYTSITCVILVIFPYSGYIYFRTRKEKRMEDFFPDFLRDLSEARRAGMTLPQAIANCALVDYGPLSPEIRRMHHQLSWGIPFPEVMKSLSERLTRSEYIRRGIAIIMESYFSGGDISASMEATADSTRVLKEVERDRLSIMQQQMLIMYVIFFIFVGILVALYKILIPLLIIPRPEEMEGEMEVIVMGEAPPMEYYKMLFFLTLTIQAICNGLIAGETKEGKIVAGVKHAGVMLAFALIAFVIFIYPVSFVLHVDVFREEVIPGGRVMLSGHVSLEGKPAVEAFVKAILEEVEEVSTTDERGDFKIEIRAPEEPGTYQILVEVEYEEHRTSKQVEITVK